MDTYRGNFIDRDTDDAPDYDYADDEIGHEPPPSPVGQDERRMQVRAYNYWASLLDGRNFPSIEDLEPEALPDFGPYSVLLDFTGGLENPAIQFLGEKLAEECGTDGTIETLDDVPSRSLLSRITDHYMQILANQAPIGFEAEFVNQRELTILYRGILLPFSSDDDTIDFIYGVINWKELADQRTTDELLLEIDQALESPNARRDEPLTDWADGPADTPSTASRLAAMAASMTTPDEDDDVLDLAGMAVPGPAFGHGSDDDWAELPALEAAEIDPADMELGDWLASARELAEAARGSEDRTRTALYAAIGRAYDFSLAAADAPAQFDELVADSGLTVQDRAPMTPVVKLVFGADYDKTRLTEYATALGHAHRLGLPRGSLANYLADAPGGLKGVVTEERKFKRGGDRPAEVRETPREALARKLRQIEPQGFDTISAEGSEFTLLIARRLPTGEVVLVGEVPEDIPLLEKAARRLIG